MNLIVWVVFGIASGLVSHWVDPEERASGVMSAIVLGILGSLLGGLLANLLLGVQVIGFNFTSFIVAVIGSVMLLFTGRLLRRT